MPCSTTVVHFAVNEVVVGSNPTGAVRLKFILDMHDKYCILRHYGAEGKPVASDTLIRCS